MTVRGDIEAIILDRIAARVSDREKAAFISDLFDWMVSADVLALIENSGTEVIEWIDGVHALRTKCGHPAYTPVTTRKH